MKLPKRISDLLKQKQAFIDSQRTKLENTVIRLESQLFNDILNDVIPLLDIKDGIIQETTNNYKLISVLNKTYKDFQTVANTAVFEQILTGTQKIATLSTSYFQIVLSGNLPERFEKIIAETNRLINLRLGINGEGIVRGGFLDSFFKSSTIGTDLTQMTSRAITSGVSMKEFTSMLRNKITGTKEYTGGMERQFQRYAYDLYQQYDAAYNKTLGNEFGFTYFIYQGGLIEDSRDFCVAHNNKVYSKDESEQWKVWTPSDGEYPDGYVIKAKDMNSTPSYMNYPGYDPLIDRGGYNCRHFLGWIPDDVAFGMRPDLKM